MAHFGVTYSARLLTLAGALLGLLLACGPHQPPAIQGPARLIVMPDDGSIALSALLRGAEHSIDVMVYLLTSQEVVRELAAAQRRGVRVRVLLEEEPVGGGQGNRVAAQELTAAGAAVRWAAPTFRFTHAKVILVDGVQAAIMTLNLTASSFRSNREFAVIVEDSSVVAALGELFESDWEHVPHPALDLPLVISPANARRVLHDLIASARQSVEIYVLSLEDDSIAAALAAAAERGVRVRIITNPPTGSDSYADERALVRAWGGFVGFLDSPNVHAKVVIVDGQRAFVGSQNFTATSLDQNREVGILVADPVALQRLQQTFESDWSQATLERGAARRLSLAA
ncbi:MAG: hypothetical protein F4X83_11755 [Chloroflexi bacterium]|nr:hypothetical protein [Chloroflexota bacterium]